MTCTGDFVEAPGATFGLKVSKGQNLWTCAALVVTAGPDSKEMRFTFDELKSGKAKWQIEDSTTYTIFLQVQSKEPGKNVSVDVEIPLGDPPSTCTRVSSGVVGVWRVIAS
jgi:hypothetical protein